MRKFFLVALAVLLVGCATIAPDNPQLQEASENANQALEKAREVGAKNNQPKEFQELTDRYNELYQTQQNQPSLELLDQYDNLERNAYELAVSTLQNRFDSLDSRVSSLQNKLEDRVSSLEKRESELQNQIEKLTQRNKKLKEKNESLRSKVESLNETNDSLKSKNSSLQARTKKIRKKTSNLRKKLKQSQSTVEKLRSRLQQRNQKLTKLQSENRQIQEELDDKLSEGAVRTEDESIYVTLESRILFKLGDVHVRDNIRPELNKIARTLKKYPDREILVEGHTDDLPLQDELKQKYGSNWELSGQRAINVLKYLVYNRDISKERIGAVAYGQFRPRVPNTSTENRAKNRRVEIVLLSSEVPQETRDLVD